MQLTIDGRHIEITEAIREYVETKIRKLKKYFPYVIDVHVVLYTQKFMQVVEVTINANRFTIHGEESSSDLYASIDLVVDKLNAQLKRYKERLVDSHQRKPPAGQGPEFEYSGLRARGHRGDETLAPGDLHPADGDQAHVGGRGGHANGLDRPELFDVPERRVEKRERDLPAQGRPLRPDRAGDGSLGLRRPDAGAPRQAWPGEDRILLENGNV